jgi:hypothetical protein
MATKKRKARKKQTPKNRVLTKGTRSRPVERRTVGIVSELSDTEKDLLWHMENGYQLETDSLGSDPVLRRLKDDEVVRPPSANRNTIKSMEERGLISQGKSRDPLQIVWRPTPR